MLRYKEVKQLILDQVAQMEPHTKLPSRSQMCEQHLISRTTIDRAITELVSDGYLYSVAGSGTYAADFNADKTSIRRDVLNVGFLVPNILHDTYPGILRGIEDVMQHHNVNVVICNTDNDLAKQRSCLKRLLNSHIDGIIMVPAVVDEQKLQSSTLPELAELSVPLVFCNRPVEGVDAPLVCSNNYYGGFLATRHLIERGYRKVAYLTPLSYYTSTARYYGYMSALWESGIELDPRLVCSVPEQSTVELGYRMMRDLLQKNKDVNGVFCFNDRLACGAINAIHEMGLRVSDDIGVIGYDNTTICDVPPERLTSVSFKKYEIGCHAAQMILGMIQKPDAPVEHLTVFRPEICHRESCNGLKV